MISLVLQISWTKEAKELMSSRFLSSNIASSPSFTALSCICCPYRHSRSTQPCYLWVPYIPNYTPISFCFHNLLRHCSRPLMEDWKGNSPHLHSFVGVEHGVESYFGLAVYFTASVARGGSTDSTVFFSHLILRALRLQLLRDRPRHGDCPEARGGDANPAWLQAREQSSKGLWGE